MWNTQTGILKNHSFADLILQIDKVLYRVTLEQLSLLLTYSRARSLVRIYRVASGRLPASGSES